KTEAFHAAAKRAGLEAFAPLLAVTFGNEPGAKFDSPTDNLHGRQRYSCRLGGECDVGCNFGSKNSLDFTYLSLAKKEGLKIRCLHEVKAFEPREGGGFRIEIADHTENAKDGSRPGVAPRRKTIVANERLILCAGALGTPYLLLRNRSAFPNLSPQL